MIRYSRLPSRTAARAFSFASTILAAHVLPAAAQTAPSEQALGAVVVTAARIEQQQADALPHTTVITAADIRNHPAADLPALLRREAGVDIVQAGGLGQQASLFMRGMASSQALILIDGVPVRRQGFQNAAAIEHILPEQIDRIEVVRGNVSAIYGSDAIGGVIQIFTKSGKGKPQTSVAVEGGSRGTGKAAVGTSGKTGDTSYALSLSRFKTGGFSAIDTGKYSFENPDRDGYRNTSLAGSLAQEWAQGQEFGVRLYANDGKFDNDGGGFGMPTDIDKGTSRQRVVTLFSKNRVTQQWLSNVSLAHTNTRDTNESTGFFGNNRFNTRINLLQWNNEYAFAQDWKLTAGFDAGRERAEVYASAPFSLNNYARSTSSVYAGINGKIDRHQLQLNLRHDRITGSGSEATGYAGYGYALTSEFKLIANASTAFHAPTMAQFFDPLFGNPNLRAERARSYELGAQYAAGDSLVRVTAFDTRTRDEFGFDPVTFRTINIGRARNRGVELSGSTTLAGVDVRASLTRQDPENQSAGTVQYRRAKRLASLALGKAVGAWRFGGEAQFGGSRLDRNFSVFPVTDVRLGSYTLVNLNASYQLNKDVSLYGRVENAFNRDYETAFGFNQPPRGAFVGLRWQM